MPINLPPAEQLLNTIPCGLVSVDTNGKVLYCNRVFQHFTGYAAGEITGQKIEIYKADQSDQYLQPLHMQEKMIRKDCLKNYMLPVIDHALQILKGDIKEDNFLSSVRLNHRMLTYTRN
jgi:PAS domain-containing protein